MLPNFVAKVTIARGSCLLLNGRMVLEQFSQFRSQLIAGVSRDAAALFAEPVVTQKGDDIEVAWYSEQAGAPVPLSALDENLRQVVGDKLRAHLAALEPLLATDLGPLLSRVLYLADTGSILAVGQEPLLIQWGLRPADIRADHQPSLDAHFEATLGPYAPFGAPRITPPVGGTPLPPRSLMPPRPITSPGSMALLASNRGLAIATGLAALCALLLMLPGVLATPAPVLAADTGDLARARDITRAMQDKVGQAKAALATSKCNEDGTFTQGGGGPAQLPPAPIPIRQGDAQTQGDMSLVARRAMESVVFILTCTERSTWADDHRDSKDGDTPIVCPNPDNGAGAGDLVVAGSGSGFFVAANRVATNTHVVRGAKAVFVTSRSLGRVSRGTVLAATVKQRTADPDFAVIGVDLDHSPQPIQIASTSSRLQNVVAAGYPGVIVQEDAQLDRLLKGDSAAAPELTTFPGFITLTMNQDQAVPLIFSSAVIGHGNSGGPLLDLCGRAVGVNTLGWSGSAEDTGYKVNVAEGATALATFLAEHQVDSVVSASVCGPPTQASNTPLPPAQPPVPTPQVK